MGTLTAIFLSVSVQYGLPANLLSSICYIESQHNVAAVHYRDGRDTSVGLCQIKLKTARGLGFRGTEKQLMEPRYNIKYAGKYLRHQIRRYHGNIAQGVIAYNMGHAGTLTTTKYQAKVFRQWKGTMYAKN